MPDTIIRTYEFKVSGETIESTSTKPSSSLPPNLFIWDKDPRVRVHRIQEEEEIFYVMLRPSLFALLGKKDIYKTYGRNIEDDYLHTVNMNEVYNQQKNDYGNYTSAKFSKWFVLNNALQRTLFLHQTIF